MNTLTDIASALAQGSSQLEQDQFLHIPLDEHRELRFLRPSGQSGVTAIVAQRSMSRTEVEDELVQTALLRLGADTRWADSLSGGMDENGWDCIALTLNDLSDSEHIEATLRRVVERLAAIAAPMPSMRPIWAWGTP